MSYMKQHLADCMEYANSGDWAELLKALEPWGENAPEQLWGVIEFLAEQQQETKNWHYTETAKHFGHEITLSKYGESNLSLECETCSEVLTDYEKGETK